MTRIDPTIYLNGRRYVRGVSLIHSWAGLMTARDVFAYRSPSDAWPVLTDQRVRFTER